MIKTAADRRTAAFLAGERVADFQGVERQMQKRLSILNDSTCIEDLMRLPSNRFERLKGDRKDQFSIRANNRWRICFRFEDGDAYDVEIVDYH